MTVATRRPAAAARTASNPTRSRSGGVVAEIAARRQADLASELADLSLPELARAAAAGPPPRDLVERLAQPGLHLVAEVKRRSPSAGAIARSDEDPVARARAYEHGGASAISVLCEPHWFGGSIADLSAVRAAVGVPVLAKEFVVDPRQLPLLRAAGADAVLLLAVLHPSRAAECPGRRRAGSRAGAAGRSARRPRARAGARHPCPGDRDQQPRSAYPRRGPGACRSSPRAGPGDRIAIAESGVREPATVAGWRAVGFDGALVGEALMRSAHPAAAARAFVAAGAFPVDPAVGDRLPIVKICGVADADGVRAAIRAGADAIGLNVVAGTPRELSLAEAAALAGQIRREAPGDRRPRIVAITADADAEPLRAIIAAIDPDVVQLNGRRDPGVAAALGRSTWKVLHLPAAEPSDLTGATAAVVERASGLPRGGCGAAAARHRRRTASRRDGHTLGGLAGGGGRP